MKLTRTTKRLVIRPFTAQDFPAWARAHAEMLPPKNRWDLKRDKPEARTPTQFSRFVKNLAGLQKKDRQYSFGIFLKNGELIGRIYLMDVSRGVFHNAYVGYFIYNRHWSKGYGKEALRAVLDLGFRQARLHRIEAGVAPGNRRSMALARAVGMRKEGFSPRRIFIRGKWTDLVLYAVTSEEYGVRWKKARRAAGRKAEQG